MDPEHHLGDPGHRAAGRVAAGRIRHGSLPGGFRGIPDDLREAARVDGASEWQLYKSIIFPQLTPIALSAVIIIGHMSLKSFDLIMSITDQRTYSTKVPAIDMFNFMTDNDYSNAAAVGTILLVLVAIAVIPYLIHDAKGRR